VYVCVIDHCHGLEAGQSKSDSGVVETDGAPHVDECVIMFYVDIDLWMVFVNAGYNIYFIKFNTTSDLC
jgi:hypothetical protein